MYDLWGFMKIHKDSIITKNGLQIAEICSQNHFRIVHESPGVIPESFLNSSWIAEIHPIIISEWFANHCALPQNHFRIVCNHRDSPQNHFKIHKSLRFTKMAPESFQNSLQITEICLRIISELFAISLNAGPLLTHLMI